MPQLAPPKRFTISSPESTLTFYVKTVVGTVYGKTQKLEGSIEAAWDNEGLLVTNPMPKMHVEFAVESLTCGTPEKDRELWKIVDCSKFPKITGDLISAQSTNNITIATGKISVGGVVRSYQGSFLIKRSVGRLDVDGFLTIGLKDFGIKDVKVLSFGMNSDVKVRMQVVAKG